MKIYERQFDEHGSNITNANVLATEIEKEVSKIFPHSYIHAEFSSSIHPSMTVRFALGKDKSEWVNGYMDNDPISMLIFIYGKEKNIEDNGDISGNLYTKTLMSSFVIKPSAGSYYVYDRVKVPFRKTTGSPEKILDYLKKYFLLLKKELQANRNNLTDEHLALIGNKF